MRMLLCLLLIGVSGLAQAFELKVEKVTGNVYALIGSTDARTYANYGLNDNLGFIVTPAGVVLIDSGASRQGAALVAAAIAKVTNKPVRWVINTGSQDHRWLGNGYFASKGAQIIALRRTVDTQREYAAQELSRLKPVLKDRLDGTVPAYAAKPIAGDHADLDLGGVRLQLLWFGDAHFPGDVVVWLPKQRVLFSGDLIFVDRILGVLPSSRVVSWRQAFKAAAKLNPKRIVPGHGEVCGLAKARRDTGDYLDWLVTEVGKAVDNWEPINDAVARLGNAPRFKYLEHYDTLHRANINHTYLQLENR